MPVKVAKRGSRWVVTDNGKVYGKHATRAKAAAQARAINASLRRKGKI